MFSRRLPTCQDKKTSAAWAKHQIPVAPSNNLADQRAGHAAWWESLEKPAQHTELNQQNRTKPLLSAKCRTYSHIEHTYLEFFSDILIRVLWIFWYLAELPLQSAAFRSIPQSTKAPKEMPGLGRSSTRSRCHRAGRCHGRWESYRSVGTPPGIEVVWIGAWVINGHHMDFTSHAFFAEENMPL